MELQHISEWAMRHNFTLNETKNKNYYQLAENSYTCVTCSNSRVEFLKVLCISFNTKLSFEPHISYIIQSAARSFYGLKTLRAHGTIPTMFCISYCLLKRTFTIICDNDLISLLFPQNTTI